MRAKAYFEALGRSAASRGLPVNFKRVERQSWPMFAKEAWASGWFMQKRNNYV